MCRGLLQIAFLLLAVDLILILLYSSMIGKNFKLLVGESIVLLNECYAHASIFFQTDICEVFQPQNRP